MFKLEKLEKVLGKELTDKLRATFSNETPEPTPTPEPELTPEPEPEPTPEPEVVMSAAQIQEAIQTALSAQAEVFNKQIETLTTQLAESKTANTAKFSSILEAIELVASLKEEAPERKADPMQKFSDKRKSAFERVLEIKNSINK